MEPAKKILRLLACEPEWRGQPGVTPEQTRLRGEVLAGKAEREHGQQAGVKKIRSVTHVSGMTPSPQSTGHCLRVKNIIWENFTQSGLLQWPTATLLQRQWHSSKKLACPWSFSKACFGMCWVIKINIICWMSNKIIRTIDLPHCPSHPCWYWPLRRRVLEPSSQYNVK